MLVNRAASRCNSSSISSISGIISSAMSSSSSSSSSSNNSSVTPSDRHFRVVVAGGGSAGAAIANRMQRQVGAGQLCVIEPSVHHFYQPLWTLVGGGVKKFEDSRADTASTLPSNAEWIQSGVASIDPDQRVVVTDNGERVTYDFLVVALGASLRYGDVEGAEAALSEDPVVCSNYHFEFVRKTWPAFQTVEANAGKNIRAIFTYPVGQTKCPGAPQKIMYLFEDYARRRGFRDRVTVQYNSSLPVIFGVKKYADELLRVCHSRDIRLNFQQPLIRVDHNRRLAWFKNLTTGEVREESYDFLHIAPSIAPRDCLANSTLSANNSGGWVSVDKETLQHPKYPNVFALGDCIDSPTTKTAAAVATQSKILTRNLLEAMAGRPADALRYNGYTSCPLITSYSRGIMAEFDYTLQPLETFPFDQGREMYSMYFVKARLLSPLYWYGLIPGWYNGPAPFRKAFDLVRLNSRQPGVVKL